MTNYEAVLNKDIEELAHFLDDCGCNTCIYQEMDSCGKLYHCHEGILKWLEEDVEDIEGE